MVERKTLGEQIENGLFKKVLIQSYFGRGRGVQFALVSSIRGVTFPVAELWENAVPVDIKDPETDLECLVREVYLRTDDGNIYGLRNFRRGEDWLREPSMVSITDSRTGDRFVLDREGARVLSVKIGKPLLVPEKYVRTKPITGIVAELREIAANLAGNRAEVEEFRTIAVEFHQRLADIRTHYIGF
jgi:hypothetical protein